MYLLMEHAPNPDIGNGTGYWAGPLSKPGMVTRKAVRDLAAASRAFMAWVEENELGSGNLTPMAGLVMGDDNEPVARISYNGRAWGMDGKEIRLAGPC